MGLLLADAKLEKVPLTVLFFDLGIQWNAPVAHIVSF